MSQDAVPECVGCGEQNYVAHDVSLCAACRRICAAATPRLLQDGWQKQPLAGFTDEQLKEFTEAAEQERQRREESRLGEAHKNEAMLGPPRKLLHFANTLIDEHISEHNRLETSTLDWALHVQRSTRFYLYHLGAPEAQPYWGKWRQNDMRSRWGNVKA